MNLYERYNKQGIPVEIVASGHIDEYELYLAAKRCYGVEIEPGSIKQKWETAILNNRKRHDKQEPYSYPVTIGRIR